MVVADDATVITNGFRIFVKTLLILNGTISNAGALDITYTDRPLGVRATGQTYNPYAPSMIASNTPDRTPFLDGLYYVSSGPQPAYCNITTALDAVQLTPSSRGGVYHLQSDVLGAIAMRDLYDLPYSAGISGCPGSFLVDNGTHVHAELWPGGSAAGIVVVAAHTIELGPNAVISISSAQAPVYNNDPDNLVIDPSAWATNSPRQCNDGGSGDRSFLQHAGGRGPAGIAVIATATTLSDAQLSALVRRVHSQVPADFVFAWNVTCNSTDHVVAVSTLEISYVSSPSPGLVFYHDVCNVAPEALADDIDNDRDGVIDAFDMDGDGLYTCADSFNASDIAARPCDCNDNDETTGDVWRDINHCGACNLTCNTTTEICARGLCVDKCGQLDTMFTMLAPVETVYDDPVVVNTTAAYFVGTEPTVLQFTYTFTATSSTQNETNVRLTFTDLRVIGNSAAESNISIWDVDDVLGMTLMHDCANNVSASTVTKGVHPLLGAPSFTLTTVQTNTICVAVVNITLHPGVTVPRVPWYEQRVSYVLSYTSESWVASTNSTTGCAFSIDSASNTFPAPVNSNTIIVYIHQWTDFVLTML
jgi:hypothetical protein